MPTRQSSQQVKNSDTVFQPHLPAEQQATAPLKPETHPAALIQRAAVDPRSMTRAETMQLQRTIGNRAVGRLLHIQTKLTVGPAGDKYEHEADRVASQVVQHLDTPSAGQFAQGQRSHSREDPEGKLHTEPDISPLSGLPFSPSMQREAQPKGDARSESSLLQRCGASDGGYAATDVEAAISRSRGSGKPLDTTLQRSMERSIGADFRGVRVHTDAQADQLNRSLQAHAFTTGQDIFFRHGAYQPGSQRGRKLIVHELIHVIQQGGKRLEARVNLDELSAGTVYDGNLGNVTARVQRCTDEESIKKLEAILKQNPQREKSEETLTQYIHRLMNDKGEELSLIDCDQAALTSYLSQGTTPLAPGKNALAATIKGTAWDFKEKAKEKWEVLKESGVKAGVKAAVKKVKKKGKEYANLGSEATIRQGPMMASGLTNVLTSTSPSPPQIPMNAPTLPDKALALTVTLEAKFKGQRQVSPEEMAKAHKYLAQLNRLMSSSSVNPAQLSGIYNDLREAAGKQDQTVLTQYPKW